MTNSPQYLGSLFYFVPFGPSNLEQHIYGKAWKKAEADDERRLKRLAPGLNVLLASVWCKKSNSFSHMERAGKNYLLATEQSSTDSLSISSWFIWRLIEHSLGTSHPLITKVIDNWKSCCTGRMSVPSIVLSRSSQNAQLITAGFSDKVSFW